MLYELVHAIDSVVEFENVDAHCDIPCKIYDPSAAQIAALSVVRLLDILEETAGGGAIASLEAQNTITRCILQKEQEAEKLKHEVRIIWGDYFKAPQIEAHPEIHDLTHQIMMKASACKQSVLRKDGEALVELVNLFAEIFWQTKEISTTRQLCPFPPELTTVYPVF